MHKCNQKLTGICSFEVFATIDTIGKKNPTKVIDKVTININQIKINENLITKIF